MSHPEPRRLLVATMFALAAALPVGVGQAEPARRAIVLSEAFSPAARAKIASASAPEAPRTSPPRRFAGPANGTALLRALGRRTPEVLAPTSGLVGALVELPRAARAEDYGLDPVVPGIGRLRARPERIEAFGLAHPELRLEVAPPLRPLLERSGRFVQATRVRAERGLDGRGALVGVADTGLDVTHPDVRDAAGKSRVAWLLDLSLRPLGLHPELEARFGVKDDATGEVVAGAVLSKADIDELLAAIASGDCVESRTKQCAPSDEVGHGTHVTGIAAASGNPTTGTGMAPGAEILFVRVTRSGSEGIENDDLVRAVEFMFDRADAEKRPAVVNLSLGSDFGPHDGTFLWEEAVARFVGPEHPGHVVVAAAGNSGSIVETPIHQSVRVTRGARMRVPVRAVDVDPADPADQAAVQIWVTFRRGADLKVGLEGPDGTWIEPVERGTEVGKNTDAYNAGVIHGAGPGSSPIPDGSSGAIVVWTGAWPPGTYAVTFEGEGMAELYLQGIADASAVGRRPAAFMHGVREGTINLPATHPSIIGVGCTANLSRWRSIAGVEVGLRVPLLDRAGGLPAALVRDDSGASYVPARDLLDGEVCWFSSAGPTAAGVQKPEISAPGAMVASSMSRNARPGQPGSIFTTAGCPTTPSGANDTRCLQTDANHGVAVGTSMSAPVVAGVVALLLQRDPTLTQDKVVALLQGGAHRFRYPAEFDDQAGPGEVDAWGALDALERMQDPRLALPSRAESWLSLSTTYVPADTSTAVTAIVELRTVGGDARADLFDAHRLAAFVAVDGRPVEPPPSLRRRGPGLWAYEWTPPPGLGGSRATFGATFDGEPIVEPRSVPIATDGWTARYPSHALGGGCAIAAPRASGASLVAVAALATLTLAARRRRLTPPRS